MADDLTYEEARLLALDAPSAEPLLELYSGAPNDLAYLKEYVLSSVTAFYGVTADTFDQPTLGSTALLRDWLNRALYQPVDLPYRPDLDASGETIASEWSDVASLLRYPAYGLCGGTAWQMFNIFRAFDYDVREFDVINGEIGISGTGDAYTESHVTTEVFVQDLGKYVVQDATYNFLARNSDGEAVNFVEARVDQYSGGPTLVLDSFNVYHFNPNFKISPEVRESDRVFFEEQWMRVPVQWASSVDGVVTSGNNWQLFPDWQQAHTVPARWNKFASDISLTTAVLRLDHAGVDWLEIAQILRDDHFVSGFQVLALGSGAVENEFVTARLQDGTYLTVDLTTDAVYVGSYDQLLTEAGGGALDLNPNTDLSDLLGPARFLSFTGNLYGDFTTEGQLPFSPPGPDVFSFARGVGTKTLLGFDGGPGAGDSVSLNGFPFRDVAELLDSASYTTNGLTLNLGGGDLVTLAGLTRHDLAADDFVVANTGGWTVRPGVDVRTGHHLAGDFDGDGVSDLVWRDQNSGQVHINGESFGTGHSFNFQFAGTGDFNGDGHDDLIQVNNVDGRLRYWSLDDGLSIRTIGTVDRVNWNPTGTGDFDGDGFTDFLWRNTTTGRLTIWKMDADGFAGSQWFGYEVSSGWKVVGTGDFDGDGRDDILWRSDTGKTGIWQNLPSGQKGYEIGPVVTGGWEVVGVGDVGNDGRDDIFWIASDGRVGVWEMNEGGRSYVGGELSMTASEGDYVAGVGDYNNDGRADLVWQDGDTGELTAWLVSGRTANAFDLGSPPDPDYFFA